MSTDLLPGEDGKPNETESSNVLSNTEASSDGSNGSTGEDSGSSLFPSDTNPSGVANGSTSLESEADLVEEQLFDENGDPIP